VEEYTWLIVFPRPGTINPPIVWKSDYGGIRIVANIRHAAHLPSLLFYYEAKPDHLLDLINTLL